MGRIDWPAFAAGIAAVAKERDRPLRYIARQLGLSHSTVHRAAAGKVVSAEAMLILCVWMEKDPCWFLRSHLPAENGDA